MCTEQARLHPRQWLERAHRAAAITTVRRRAPGLPLPPPTPTHTTDTTRISFYNRPKPVEPLKHLYLVDTTQIGGETFVRVGLALEQVSMGLESDSSARSADGSTKYGFVDIYGTAFGRDVEPTMVRNLPNTILRLFWSCM